MLVMMTMTMGMMFNCMINECSLQEPFVLLCCVEDADTEEDDNADDDVEYDYDGDNNDDTDDDVED